MAKYSALAIANYFISKGTIEDEEIDHLKLQKLVYLAHGWSLAVFEEPLIDEPIEAWRYGPVVQSLYQSFKRYGNDEIVENGIDYRGGRLSVPTIDKHDDATRQLLERVWSIYKPYSGIQLSNLTHEPGTPWDKTWQTSHSGRAPIPDSVIAQHFLTKARRGQEAGSP